VLEDIVLMDTKEVFLNINTNMLWISSRMSKALNLRVQVGPSAGSASAPHQTAMNKRDAAPVRKI
jgi:hypothetical protein